MQLEILVGWKKLKIAIENSCSYLEISAFGADRWKLFNWLEIDAVTFKIFQLAGNSCSSTLKLQLALHSFARVLAFIKTGFGVAELWTRYKGVNSITLKLIMYQRHIAMHRYPIINENKYRSDRIFFLQARGTCWLAGYQHNENPFQLCRERMNEHLSLFLIIFNGNVLFSC